MGWGDHLCQRRYRLYILGRDGRGSYWMHRCVNRWNLMSSHCGDRLNFRLNVLDIWVANLLDLRRHVNWPCDCWICGSMSVTFWLRFFRKLAPFLRWSDWLGSHRSHVVVVEFVELGVQFVWNFGKSHAWGYLVKLGHSLAWGGSVWGQISVPWTETRLVLRRAARTLHLIVIFGLLSRCFFLLYLHIGIESVCCWLLTCCCQGVLGTRGHQILRLLRNAVLGGYLAETGRSGWGHWIVLYGHGHKLLDGLGGCHCRQSGKTARSHVIVSADLIRWLIKVQSFVHASDSVLLRRKVLLYVPMGHALSPSHHFI